MAGIDYFGRGLFMGDRPFFTAPVNVKWPAVKAPPPYGIWPVTFAESPPEVEVEVRESFVMGQAPPAAPPPPAPPPSAAECAVTCGIRAGIFAAVLLAGGAVAWAAGAFGSKR